MADPLEMNLDELRDALAPLVPKHAAFDGWSNEALAMAAEELGVPADRARLAFPGGQAQMIDAWFDWVDKAMLDAFPDERIAALKIRERIRDLILFLLETMAPQR
ncbi:MAG: COQ9 family protein, partial [Sphingosinicella sp.]